MHGRLVRGRDRARGPVWLASLPDRDFGRVDFLVGLLAEHAGDLGEPYTRHLGGKVRELRFHLLRGRPESPTGSPPGGG
jgi:Phage derived protein Gp49-like (DUF891)